MMSLSSSLLSRHDQLLACGRRCPGGSSALFSATARPQQRPRVLLRVHPEKPVFSIDDRPQSLNMADIMDAYDVCSLIPDPNERHQCYGVFGLDAEAMSAYYDTVCRLERQLSSTLDAPTGHSSPSLPWQPRHPNHPNHHHAPAITGAAPPPPAAAAAVAVAMLAIASQHLAFF